MFLRNVGEHLPDYIASHRRRQHSSQSLSCILFPLGQFLVKKGKGKIVPVLN
jgi:hypothetical protein